MIRLRNILIALAVFTLIKCSKQQGNKERLISNEIQVQDYESLIRGVWAETEEDNAFFSVKGDSLYFIEHLNEPVPFEIIGDTLRSFYDGIITNDIILKLNNDSLILRDEQEQIIRLYRR